MACGQSAVSGVSSPTLLDEQSVFSASSSVAIFQLSPPAMSIPAIMRGGRIGCEIIFR
jgi:hypothetical protein